MSSQNNAQPDLNGAYNTVVERIHAPAFFHKLAQLGHVPQSQQEADSLLQLGFQLQNVETQSKQASTGPYAGALQSLNAISGQSQQAAKVAEWNQIKAAAFQMAGDPAILEAAAAMHRAAQVA